MNLAAPVIVTLDGPQPLLRELPPGRPYPAHALGKLRHPVMAAHDITQAPVAIAAQSALSVASLAAQAFADVETLSGFVPLSLFCLTIAKSGERKSATDKVLMTGLVDHERKRAVDYREKLVSWRNTHALWKAGHDQILKDAKKKGEAARTAARADLENLGAEPAAPLTPNLIATEPTLEGLHKLFQSGQPSLGMFSDEGGQFLGGHAMNSENRLKTLAGLSALWGGDPINRTRAGDGTSTIYGRRLTIHLMVQPKVARPLMVDPLACGQGLLARFLIAEPSSTIGTRLKRGYSESSGLEVSAMAERLKRILETPKPAADGYTQELKPRQLILSSGAKELLWQYYETVETAQKSGGLFEHLSAFASKSAEQAARIAGVLTIWDNPNAIDVSAETMAGAITLAQHYLGEALRLTEAAEISSEIGRAERLRLWLLNEWPKRASSIGRDPNFILPGDVVQFGPNALRVTRDVKKLLKILDDHDWLSALEKGAEVDGTSRKLSYRILSGHCNAV